MAGIAGLTGWNRLNLLGVSERPCDVDPHVVNISQVTDSGAESSPTSLLTIVDRSGLDGWQMGLNLGRSQLGCPPKLD